MLKPDSRGGSYFEAYRRKAGITPELLRRERLLTDRGAYLNFLEVQLERVSAACLSSHASVERVDELAAQIATLEEKV
ncbi:unnamed protein product, partial [Phaeothamnion confervicola]